MATMGSEKGAETRRGPKSSRPTGPVPGLGVSKGLNASKSESGAATTDCSEPVRAKRRRTSKETSPGVDAPVASIAAKGQAARYRSVRKMSRELKEQCRIYLEEGLCESRFRLLALSYALVCCSFCSPVLTME
jgi:hypothetical protein